MEKPELGRLVICSIVVFLGTLAFSCSVAAEFEKVKVMMAGDPFWIVMDRSTKTTEPLEWVFAGPGYETGWKPVFVAEELRFRIGDRSGRLPFDSPDCWDLRSMYSLGR
ncbi:hypothetical protein COCNU_07G015690 [Cocos nucifera]|uniref:Uncharacterized protein n=1 Tax=Cocos nucifera TaxID=13894 RepID=A0A8K0IH82_COCNU|nr:hypothetical protein COCNU_07G015690 [Cocos nucifera]